MAFWSQLGRCPRRPAGGEAPKPSGRWHAGSSRHKAGVLVQDGVAVKCVTWRDAADFRKL